MRCIVVLAIGFCACARPEPPSPFRIRIAAIGPLAPLSPDLNDGYGMMVNWLVFESLLQPESNGRWKSTVSRNWQKLGETGFRFQSASVSFSDGTVVRPQDFETALGGRVTAEETDGWVTLRGRDGGLSSEGELLSAVLWRPSDRGPMGTGPFVVVTQDPTQILLRRRNPPGRRAAEISLVSFATPRDAFAAALRGEVDVLLMPDDGQQELLAGVEQLRLIRGPGIHSVGAFFNPVRMGSEERKALARALPLEGVATAYGSLCRREASSGSSGELPPGRPVDLVVPDTFQGLARIVVALRRALGPRGGSVSVVTPEEAQSRLLAGDFDLLISTYQTWPADYATSKWLTGSPRNLTGYSNPRVDEALQASDYTLAQKELAADPPALVFCRLDHTAAVSARLFDARLGTYDMLESIDTWQVAP